MRQRTSSAILIFSAILLAGCQRGSLPFQCDDSLGCVSVAPGAPVKIGVLQVQSGDQAVFGLANLRSIELALEERDHSILSHPLEIRSEDSKCSQEGGSTAASKIVADPQVLGIIGPTCSGAAASAMKVATEAGLSMVSGSCTAPSLTSAGGERGSEWQPGFFRTAPNDAVSSQAAATFAVKRLGAVKAATIDDGDLYTRGQTDAFEQAFTELGGEVVISATVNKGDSDMVPVLTAVARSGADLVFLPVFRPEGDYIVLQARDMEELDSATLMSAEGLYVTGFGEAVGEAGIGLHMVIPAPPQGEALVAFSARYERRFGEVPNLPYYAQTYDAANLLLDAVERVALGETDGTLHFGRQALRDALYATEGYQGLTGSLTCDDHGDCGSARFQVIRLDDPSAGLEGMAANVVFTYPPVQ
jgi:branched-chain amino acid transport system substrate-binding protein